MQSGQGSVSLIVNTIFCIRGNLEIALEVSVVLKLHLHHWTILNPFTVQLIMTFSSILRFQNSHCSSLLTLCSVAVMAAAVW